MIGAIADTYIAMLGTGRTQQAQRVEAVPKVERRDNQQKDAGKNGGQIEDSFEMSPEAAAKMASNEKSDAKAAAPKPAGASPDENLSEEEKKEVEEMKARDQEVRTHEQAHMAAGAGLVNGPYYEEATGPDGRRYATGGSVQIDTSEASTPEATIAKAQKIKAAANAPAEPSGQDRSVAAAAMEMEAEARKELAEAPDDSAKAQENDKSKGHLAIKAYKQQANNSQKSYNISLSV